MLIFISALRIRNTVSYTIRVAYVLGRANHDRAEVAHSMGPDYIVICLCMYVCMKRCFRQRKMEPVAIMPWDL